MDQVISLYPEEITFSDVRVNQVYIQALEITNNLQNAVSFRIRLVFESMVTRKAIRGFEHTLRTHSFHTVSLACLCLPSVLPLFCGDCAGTGLLIWTDLQLSRQQ
jgi:hypothetical protein